MLQLGSGNDPLALLTRSRPYVRPCHIIKDVSTQRAATARGEETGIGIREVPVGGVNALIECYGSDEFIGKSVRSLRERV